MQLSHVRKHSDHNYVEKENKQDINVSLPANSREECNLGSEKKRDLILTSQLLLMEKTNVPGKTTN